MDSLTYLGPKPPPTVDVLGGLDSHSGATPAPKEFSTVNCTPVDVDILDSVSRSLGMLSQPIKLLGKGDRSLFVVLTGCLVNRP